MVSENLEYNDNNRKVISCHVLVIGSGGSGTRAAIEASQSGETILVTRTIAGKGGCTTMAEGGYNAVMKEDDSCPLHEEDTLKGGAYLNDPKLVDILVNESPERMNDLVKWGAVFDVTPEREIAQRPFGGQRFPRTCYAGDRTGHEIMMTLIERLRSSDVTVLAEVTVIELLKAGDIVCGAAAIDIKGNLVIIEADAVVLATGGGTQVYDISTNCATGNGQGFAMGYRAGAELIDMEMVQFHPTGAVHPYDARGRLITEAVRGEGGLLKDSEGRRFMEKYDPVRMELSTRDVVSRAIATEILEGRGTDKGGVYLDVSHLGDKEIEEKLPVMLEQFLLSGVDIRKEPMEVAPTAHHIMGGLRITPECRTTVKGLFACGEVTGGVHGANRLGGNALADTQVFGRRAGFYAGSEPEMEKVADEHQIGIIRQKLDSYLSGDTNPAEIKKRLKRVMWDDAGIFRTGEKLKLALREIAELKKLKPKAADSGSFIDCWTIQDMLEVAELIVKGAIMREESRGAHVRADIETAWNADKSPFGHTFQSISRSGIEKKEDC
ncbi:fumarate reductase (CoM/CoB) subunit TfrA [Methanoplanus endosymbiosus]|uniref:Fumarate reductase subunit A n=1 Tax=Methanoplanus endosymbiosus TaxID=33865 RepID=A0A9E7PK40_9EURY|nr:fumarate reductase (CoM/CoB) subunit TfrA [Methanoplanus endosymbiosus]UUX91444.1 fumarate reductase subunit A [Methanoplanus endosymbiosus]